MDVTRIVLATQNKGKLIEFSRIFLPLGIEIVKQGDVTEDFDVVEDADTFEGNALLKAKAVYEKCGIPTIADDSGLEVDYLDGAPGVHTARYAGENKDTDANIDKLLFELRDIDKPLRTARFVSAIALVLSHDESIVVRGECEGSIAKERMGEGGFGYDPVFMVDDVSYSMMSAKQKDDISHRGRAIAAIIKKLKETGIIDQ